MAHHGKPEEHAHETAGGSHPAYSHSAHGRPAMPTAKDAHGKIQGQRPGEVAEGDSQFHYALYTVFAREGAPSATANSAEATAELNAVVENLKSRGVTVRGFYDVSAMRNDADVMVWVHGEKPEELQAAIRDIRRTDAFFGTKIVWSTMGVHRDAEFSAGHTPSFAKGIDPEKWVCVYPFVRSYDWYTINPEKRREIMKNHGMKGIDFPEVLPNTIATFGLNDYEWLIALEAPELVLLVDLMRSFRNTEARLYVRDELPFYTGRRIEAGEVAKVLA
ncbi:hydrogen peroxide-dependent heme synthase [Rothia terrae]|uniref:hydrogen peroxide-dependent heme synthase n=1 Tax=Rothia terrae TaxID=396015 RepID=UPI001FF90EAC|nr:hydrogen peroxide-dependent heme synthase [Rothia terrae]MDT0189168.1 chlorite dismutase family protein [Rothia terrae]